MSSENENPDEVFDFSAPAKSDEASSVDSSKKTQEKPKIVNKRRFWNILLKPKQQIKYSGYYFFIALCCLVVVNFILVQFLIKLANLGNVAEPGTHVSLLLTETLKANQWFIASGCFVIFFSLLLFAIRMSHNVVGPAFALSKHVDALIAGDYKFKTKLREKDEFKFLQDKLNELSQTLEAKYGDLEADIKTVSSANMDSLVVGDRTFSEDEIKAPEEAKEESAKNAVESKTIDLVGSSSEDEASKEEASDTEWVIEPKMRSS